MTTIEEFDNREQRSAKMGQAIFLTISELLDRAAAAGVFLSYSQEGLHFKLSVDDFPALLKSEIVTNKVALLAFLRQRQLEDKSTLSLPPIRTYNRAFQPAVLSFAQQRLWFIDQLGGGSVQYNMPAALRIEGGFDEGVAEQSLRRIIERHEPLRTVFGNGADGPLQEIRAAFDFHLTRIDLSGLLAEAQEQAVAEALNLDAVKPFDLSADLMLRASFIRLSGEESVLLFNMHHIASDGWSMGILVSEFAELYEAFSQGRPDPLTALAIQYADYARWQRDWLAGEVLERQLSYWERQLAELPQVHGLPLDWPRPAVQSFAGATERFEVEGATLDGLKRLAQESQTTLFMVLQGVFALLLSRYANSSDVVMGIPVANRSQKELEPLVGFFVNTVVIRTDCSGGRTFREYLGQVRRVNLEAQANQDVPFEYLVERLKPQRSSSHGALFQIMFSMEGGAGGAGAATGQLTGLTMTPLRSEQVAVKFDLTLEALEQAEGLSLSLAYNRDLFAAGTIARMGEHLGNLVRGVVADPETKIEMLPLLSESEREQLLRGVNATATEYPRESCLHELFEAQVERSPEAVAVVFEHTELSYGELNRRANQLGQYLRKLGVGPEGLVAICLERGIEMIVALLAVLKTGAAYLPLDPSYPQERLGYMLEDSEAQVLVTQEGLLAQLPAYKGAVVSVDQQREKIAGESSHNVKGAALPQNLAYTIYTSGSTGKPKGVQISHGALVNFVCSMRSRPGIGPQDVLLAVTSLSFDIAGLELYLPLTVGACVKILSREAAMDGAMLLRELDQGATMIQATPATWLLLLEAAWEGSPALKALCGGEALSSDLSRRLIGRCDSLWNMYGPTETTIWSLVEEIEGADEQISIGHPIANTQAYVLTEGGQLAPLGVAGELYIGGEGLARGYLKRGDLTAERFVPNPFGVEAGGRLYRTGDLARWLPEDRLEFLGRSDQQVKLRGYRIELGEIEQQLSGIAGVSAAVVMAREDEPGQRRLVGYVTMEEGARQGVSEVDLHLGLRKALQSHLPDYMVPSAFVILDGFPLTPNGKLNRKALPAPEPSGPVSPEPTSPVEQILCSIFCQVLRLESISIHDNFFEMGGHSLLATQVISRIRNAFSVDLSLHVLFEAPWVAALAPHVQLAMQMEVDIPTPPMVAVDRSKPLPLSYAQQRLWFIDQLESDTSLYNIPFALKFTGPLDIAAVESSFNEIVRRHEVLRTYFSSTDGEPMQIIGDYKPFRLDVMDLSAEDKPEQIDSRIELLAYQEAHQPFDLSVGPLLRTKLLRLADDQHVLLVTMHHIISDGWSFSILIKEYSTLYEAFLLEQSAGLADLPVQYADFAVWQRSWLQGDVLEGQLEYWRRQLDALPVLELPTDFPRPAVASHRGDVVTFQLPDELSQKLKQISRQHDVTLFMTLLAAFQVLLARYTNQSDVAVGTDIANRNRLEIESLIGFFVNQLVLRADLSDNPSFIELLQQVRRNALDAYVHQDLPFEKLVDELQPQRDLSRAPLFQVKLVLQNAAKIDLQLPALKISSLEELHQVAKFDLTFVFEESLSSIKGYLEFATDLFCLETANRIVSHFCVLLESIADSPSQRVRNLPMLTQAERDQLLFDFNDTSRDFPRSRCVHQLFQSQTEVSPESVALVFQDQTVSYRQLNERANQLAHYLLSLGVGAEVRVAVCMQRSIEMIVALLAILKAGAAYVPIDPDCPVERIAWLLDDSQCPVLLTQESLLDSLPSVWAQIFCVDSEWENVRSFSILNPETFTCSANLAYVMYTSGSTGSPKGVEVTHISIVRLLMSVDYAQFGPSLAFLQISPFAFDASTMEIWAPLLHGGRCLLYPERIPLPEHLAKFILDEQVNAAWLTSSLFNAVIDEMPLALAPLRQLLIGGEALSVTHVRKAIQILGSTCLINGYGPTEGTTFTCCFRIPARIEALTDIRSVPIGSAISNTRVYILDSEYELVPIGVAGELFIAGDGLARGYLNDPGLTAEKFLPDRFGLEAGGRLYRSGDLARWRADGRVEYLGRIDHQVKLRGYRIELGEIESNLCSRPEVQDAAVLLWEDEAGDKRLVAYIVPSSLPWEDFGSLRGYLEQTLPHYMVPAHFILLNEMPLTPNGKLDRKALPSPEGEDVQAAVYVAPRNATEQAMCEVWQEVLGLDRIGIEDNFFSLGGDSILSIRIVSMLKGRGVSVEIKDIFQHQTIEQLAAPARQGGLEQETFIDTKQIAQLLISQRDELDENVSETIL